MFKVEVITDCPHIRKACGVVNMEPSLISKLASAVLDPDEWAILLLGTREDGGYVVNVTGYTVPPQRRSTGHVSIDEINLDENVVGVIHSHHQMGAFFSTTDEQELNPRFPISIVVAHGSKTYLGFDYKGTGKVILPCGSQGEIEFKIQPLVGPLVQSVSKATHDVSNLGGCAHITNNAKDIYHVQFNTACGISTKEQLKAHAFGEDTELLNSVALLQRPVSNLKGVRVITGLLTQNEIRDDPDSMFCNTHKKWDFCKHNAKADKNTHCSKCGFFKEFCKCVDTSHIIRSPFANLNTYKLGDSKCEDCGHWNDFCVCEGSEPVTNGWLTKYEEMVSRHSIDEDIVLEKEDDELVWCEICIEYLSFTEGTCTKCGISYCPHCEVGHINGSCSFVKENEGIDWNDVHWNNDYCKNCDSVHSGSCEQDVITLDAIDVTGGYLK